MINWESLFIINSKLVGETLNHYLKKDDFPLISEILWHSHVGNFTESAQLSYYFTYSVWKLYIQNLLGIDELNGA